MRAETVLEVIDALSDEEKARLYIKLGIVKVPKQRMKKALMTESMAMKYILNLYRPL